MLSSVGPGPDWGQLHAGVAQGGQCWKRELRGNGRDAGLQQPHPHTGPGSGMQELLCLDAGNLAGGNASSQTLDHTKCFVNKEAASNYPFYGNEDAAPTLQCSLPAPSLSPPSPSLALH